MLNSLGGRQKRMKTKKLHDDLHTIEQCFQDNFYVGIVEEFTACYNHWEFRKKEPFREEGIQLPRFGNIFKPKGVGDLGDNLLFINAGEIAKYQVQKILGRKVDLRRVNTNIQFAGQESTLHEDGGADSWTYCVFVQASWHEEFGGPFQIIIEEESTKPFTRGSVHEFLVPYRPNCGVLFRGDHSHRGYAPNHLCPKERMSLAFTYTEVRDRIL